MAPGLAPPQVQGRARGPPGSQQGLSPSLLSTLLKLSLWQLLTSGRREGWPVAPQRGDRTWVVCMQAPAAGVQATALTTAYLLLVSWGPGGSSHTALFVPEVLVPGQGLARSGDPVRAQRDLSVSGRPHSRPVLTPGSPLLPPSPGFPQGWPRQVLRKRL